MNKNVTAIKDKLNINSLELYALAGAMIVFMYYHLWFFLSPRRWSYFESFDYITNALSGLAVLVLTIIIFAGCLKIAKHISFGAAFVGAWLIGEMNHLSFVNNNFMWSKLRGETNNGLSRANVLVALVILTPLLCAIIHVGRAKFLNKKA